MHDIINVNMRTTEQWNRFPKANEEKIMMYTSKRASHTLYEFISGLSMKYDLFLISNI